MYVYLFPVGFCIPLLTIKGRQIKLHPDTFITNLVVYHEENRAEPNCYASLSITPRRDNTKSSLSHTPVSRFQISTCPKLPVQDAANNEGNYALCSTDSILIRQYE